MSAKPILLVDDDSEDRRLLEHLLKDAGYQVLQAASGEEALLLLPTFPDLYAILMDIRMPGITGTEAARHIRENAERRAIPIYAVSAYLSFSVLSPTDDTSPFAATFAKPIDEDELLGCLAGLR